jgi:hypothetical protein
MTFEETIKEIESYGVELRNDWSDFDGRVARNVLNNFAVDLRNNGIDKQHVIDTLNKLSVEFLKTGSAYNFDMSQQIIVKIRQELKL